MPALSSRALFGLGLAIVAVAALAQIVIHVVVYGSGGTWTSSMTILRLAQSAQLLLNALAVVGGGLVAGSFVVAALTAQRPESGRPPTG